MISAPPGWSSDGNWFWDGLKWNDAISPDGKSRYNGREWKPFKGQRSLMPPSPLPQSAAPPPPTPAPPPDLPSWVAQSEVDRLAQEKRDREVFAVQAALPQMPPPPELDWRLVGQRMKYSKPEREYAEWQVGPLSQVIFLLLYGAGAIGAFVFIWHTGWRFQSKVIVTLVSILAPVLVAFIYLARRQVAP